MFKMLRKFRSQAGFTMIELLVVIAVIGVLAVAVLSSINPIEQINKGRDTRSRSDAAQLISAVDRFFAIHENYPWNEENVTGQAGSFAASWAEYDASTSPWGTDLDDYRSEFEFNEGDEAAVDAAEDWAWVLPLVNTAEIKDSFVTRIANPEDNTDFYVFKPDGANKTMYVCFTPSSFSFDLEASERCNSNSDSYDQQLDNDVPEACGDHDNDGQDCDASTSDEDKCWVCLP